MSKPRRRAHGAESEEHEGGMERWLLTYADMITLLLALFIILFAMSTISMRKFAEFKTGFVIGSRTDVAAITSGGKGLLQQTSLVSHPGSVQSLQQRAEAALRSLQSQIQASLSSHGLQSDAQVVLEQRGLVVRVLSDKVFFATDSADLGPGGKRVVDIIGQAVSGLPNFISVEGYTDDQPILGGPYTSNFELSAVRAISVVERLVATDGVAANHISGTGYGETHPLAPNDSRAHMAENRRVDVVILSTDSAH